MSTAKRWYVVLCDSGVLGVHTANECAQLYGLDADQVRDAGKNLTTMKDKYTIAQVELYERITCEWEEACKKVRKGLG